MKKCHLIVIYVFIGIFFASCASRKESKHHDVIERFPPNLFAILDSIVEEGRQLYYSERLNWVATDIVLEQHRQDEIGGSVSWKTNDSIWTVIFFDEQMENCIFESKFNFALNDYTVTYSSRPLTLFEKDKIQRRDKMITEAINVYGDSLRFAGAEFGSPNIDIVRINDSLTRIYFLQGTVMPNVIPFGNDYSVDFNSKLEPIAFRRYHSSLIPVRTKFEDGRSSTMVMHSHLKDNPFITPTDICNFLLYRSEDLDMFFVYSTAYKCKFAYSLQLNKIITAVE